MANTTRITTIQRHLGTAAERAGMSTTGLPIGSTFEETDTKLVYVWDPVTDTWYLHPAISATMDDLTILGSLITTPSTAQVINANGDAILADATMVELNPDGDYTLTSTPTIADGTEGQWLVITVAAGEANTVTVQDQGTLASTNILLLNSIASRTIADGDTLLLWFNGTDWLEYGGLMEVDISTDTNLAVTAPIVLTDDTLSFVHTAAVSHADTIDDFDAAEAFTVNITGIASNNPVVRRVQLYIYNDPTADENINCRLSFYSSDSMTEDELLNDFYFNLTYTETNGGASGTDTTDTVDDISGLVKYDLIRYLGGTAENVRLTATPTGTTLTFTALAGAHADNTGIVRVAEITTMFQLVDADASNEIHARLEMLSAPTADTDVAIIVDVQ